MWAVWRNCGTVHQRLSFPVNFPDFANWAAQRGQFGHMCAAGSQWTYRLSLLANTLDCLRHQRAKMLFHLPLFPPVAFHQICSRPAAVPDSLMGLRLQQRAAKLALMRRRLAVTHSLGPPHIKFDKAGEGKRLGFTFYIEMNGRDVGK